MNTVDIFTAGLGLTEPWYVSDVQLIPSEESHELELHISVDFDRGAKFNVLDDDGNVLCDANGQPLELKATDTVERTWRHLNFFQYKTYLHARVPKVRWNGKCPQISVPWARKHSGFTLLFEAMVLEYAKHMTVSVLARLVKENDKRLWRIIKHYVEAALALVDMSEVEMLGMDETSMKGHNYITLIVDLKTHRVLFVTEGKDASTIDTFVKDFKAHGGDVYADPRTAPARGFEVLPQIPVNPLDYPTQICYNKTNSISKAVTLHDFSEYSEVLSRAT